MAQSLNTTELLPLAHKTLDRNDFFTLTLTVQERPKVLIPVYNIVTKSGHLLRVFFLKHDINIGLSQVEHYTKAESQQAFPPLQGLLIMITIQQKSSLGRILL